MREDFLHLIEKIKHIKSTDEAVRLLLLRINTPLINEAIEFAIKAHSGQKRKSGEDYVVHPILVAAITSYFSEDEDVIAAAILHDIVEDTDYTIYYIKDKVSSMNRIVYISY